MKWKKFGKKRFQELNGHNDVYDDDHIKAVYYCRIACSMHLFLFSHGPGHWAYLTTNTNMSARQIADSYEDGIAIDLSNDNLDSIVTAMKGLKVLKEKEINLW